MCQRHTVDHSQRNALVESIREAERAGMAQAIPDSPVNKRRSYQGNCRIASRRLRPRLRHPVPCDCEREAGGGPAAENGNLRRKDDAQNVPAGRSE